MKAIFSTNCFCFLSVKLIRYFSANESWTPRSTKMIFNRLKEIFIFLNSASYKLKVRSHPYVSKANFHPVCLMNTSKLYVYELTNSDENFVL